MTYLGVKMTNLDIDITNLPIYNLSRIVRQIFNVATIRQIFQLFFVIIKMEIFSAIHKELFDCIMFSELLFANISSRA